jgi:hypothetical protein
MTQQKMKTEFAIYSLGIALFCAFASTTPPQNRGTPQVLPKPEHVFSDAKIGRTYKDSKPGTMVLTKAPAGAPNVLTILMDDSGFGHPRSAMLDFSLPNHRAQFIAARDSRNRRIPHLYVA